MTEAEVQGDEGVDSELQGYAVPVTALLGCIAADGGLRVISGDETRKSMHYVMSKAERSRTLESQSESLSAAEGVTDG